MLLVPGPASADKLEELERAVHAQQKAIELQQAQMRQLQEELVRLRQERAAQQEEMTRGVVEAEKKAEEVKASSLTAGYKDGFFLKSADDRFRLDLTGYIQNWFILEAGDRQQGNTYRTRRVRLNMNGTLFSDFGYNFESDFTGNARLEEGWVS